MLCPKCNSQNPDSGDVCGVCGNILSKTILQGQVGKPKLSKLAVWSFILGILSLILSFPGVAASIVCGIIGICKVSKSGGQLRGKGFAIAGIAISVIYSVAFVAVFYIWSIDAELLENDYTIVDIRSANSNNGSYEILLSLSSKQDDSRDCPEIGLSADDVNLIHKINGIIGSSCSKYKCQKPSYAEISEGIKKNADSINLLWQKGQKGRGIISKLNAYDEIFDLTEPNLKSTTGFLKSIRILAYLYQAHIYLLVEQGDGQAASNELIEFDSVSRKLSLGAAPLITKLVCYGLLSMNLQTANYIINNPNAKQETVELLSKHFTPLTNEYTSIRSSAIFEYLMFKTEIRRAMGCINCPNPFYKPNSTLRFYRNRLSRWINLEQSTGVSQSEKLEIWPLAYPKWMTVMDANGQPSRVYKYYNPIGYLLVQILTPALERICELKTNLEITDDLLQIVLNKKLHRDINLKARAYGDEYIIDVAGGEIYSPGPDRIADTNDDIKLSVNPNLLEK